VRQVLVKKSVDDVRADFFVTGASSGKPMREMRNASDVPPDCSCGVPPFTQITGVLSERNLQHRFFRPRIRWPRGSATLCLWHDALLPAG
jgi:hypothetical protein